MIRLSPPVLLGACAGLAISAVGTSSPASALDFKFSFGNVVGSTPGTVEGRIMGLADNATSPAVQVFIDSTPAALGFGPSPVNAMTFFNQVTENSFTVANAQVVEGSFFANTSGSAPWFWLNRNGINFLGNPVNNAFNVWNSDGFSGLTFTRITSTNVPAPAPIFGAAFAFSASRRIRRRISARR